MQVETARLIATIAHGAMGATRTGGEPYIVHPIRVEQLVRWFCYQYVGEIAPHAEMTGTLKNLTFIDMRVGAFLHDVIEDTKLKYSDLQREGATPNQLDIIWRLTKVPANEPATKHYYHCISDSTPALVVKCADRCSNLEDAYKELLVPPEQLKVRRWTKYVNKTYDDVLPMYNALPGLKSELEWRLKRIERELPWSEARRRVYLDSIGR